MHICETDFLTFYDYDERGKLSNVIIEVIQVQLGRTSQPKLPSQENQL